MSEFKAQFLKSGKKRIRMPVHESSKTVHTHTHIVIKKFYSFVKTSNRTE